MSTADNEIGVYCSYAKHAALKTKSNDWLTQNHDNGVKCIPAHCSFSVPTLYKFHKACVSSTNRTSSLCHRYVTSSRHGMAEQLPI